MDPKSLYDKVVEILAVYAKNEKGLKNISEKSRIIEDLGINSARMIDIVADFEAKLGATVDDESADGMSTVGDAVRILSQKINR